MKRQRFAPIIGVSLLCLSTWATAHGSHFRGAALVPSVNSSGIMTVTATTFWRKGAADILGISVGGLGGFSPTSTSLDTSDARYDVRTSTFSVTLPSAGTYGVSMTSCCRIASGGRANWSESTWTMNSTLVWDGSSANTPIAFNFASVQSQVSRLGAYSDNLDATSPSGHTLSYNQVLNQSINFQPTPSFLVDPTTGLMTIPSGETPLITDNTTLGGANVGGDAAFSGNILSSDGSSVEFDWMFDGVDSAINNAPDVGDGSDFGVVGTIFNFLFPITDPEGETLGMGLSFDPGLFGILGPVPAIAPIFDHLTGLLTWDSTGSALGTYIFQVRGRDSGNLTDVGSYTVDLVNVSAPGVVPEPASIIVHGGIALCGLGGALVARRKRRKAE
jgi:hypothetical protein